MEKMLVNIEPGSGILGTYRDQSYKLEGAFAEFIDNSTQSFFNNRNALAEIGQMSCKIVIEIYPEQIRIVDNAFGMEESDFRRALKLNSPPADKSGRSEKGMGLKTAATCLGSLWSVETTQYGSKNKYFCRVDVDEVERESPESIEATIEECDLDQHYTIIQIEALNKKITDGKIQKLIKTLSEMYSKDIRNGDLILIINKVPVKYEEPPLRVNPETGSVYMEVFERSFIVDGKTYQFDGWVGIRQVGDTEFSGFTLFRKGRAIKMHYRPTQLLGKPNLYPYQRIIGEVNLIGDNWKPSYTKDELMWEGELEERFIAELKSASSAMISLSSVLRKEEKPVSKEKKRAISAKVSKTFQAEDDTGIVISSGDDSVQVDTESTLAKAGDAAVIETDAHVDHVTDTVHDDEPDKIELVIQGVTYTFWVAWINNNYDDGFKLNLRNESNEYDLRINYGLPYFGEGTKTQKELELIQKMAITICAAIITAKKNGDKEAYRTLSIINSILRGTK